jgi:hypothetical protein
MKALLGTVVVENQGGASGTLGAAMVARAQPDGHTLLLAGSGQLGVYKVMANRPTYDPIKDLPNYRGGSHVLCDSGPPFGARPKPHGACGLREN